MKKQIPSISGSELVEQLKAGEEREFEIAPGVKIVMCWIPPGEFLMGSPDYEERRDDGVFQHRVKITRGFWMSKYQTTQAQWRAVMGNNPSYFEGDDLPVETVSWNDICGDNSRTGGFLAKLNQFGSIDGRFDLPSEAQWEYACRAGNAAPGADDLGEMAWYGENSGGETHPVGLKQANDWGLHDMLGNVWEWCTDWDGCDGCGYCKECEELEELEELEEYVIEDPAGPVNGSNKMMRGGCLDSISSDCRITSRDLYHELVKIESIGFRVIYYSVFHQVSTAKQLERSLVASNGRSG